MVLVGIDANPRDELVVTNAFDSFGKKRESVVIDEVLDVRMFEKHLVDSFVLGQIDLGDDVSTIVVGNLGDWNIVDMNGLGLGMIGGEWTHAFGVGGVGADSVGIVGATKEHCVDLLQIHQNLIVVVRQVFELHCRHF